MDKLHLTLEYEQTTSHAAVWTNYISRLSMDKLHLTLEYGQTTSHTGVWTNYISRWSMDKLHLTLEYGQTTSQVRLRFIVGLQPRAFGVQLPCEYLS